MADISNMKIGSDTYDFKDATARGLLDGLFKFETIRESYSVASNTVAQGTFGSFTIPSGYKFLGVIPFCEYNDRFLVTLSPGMNYTPSTTPTSVTIYYVIHNTNPSASVTKNIVGVGIFVKDSYYNNNVIT